MKSLEYYEKLPYRLEIVEDAEEGGYSAYYPELPGCATFADTLEQAAQNAREAKHEWLKAALEDGIHINEPDDGKYSGQFRIRMPRSLHRELAEHAKMDGVSMNQYCVYLLTKSQTEGMIVTPHAYAQVHATSKLDNNG